MPAERGRVYFIGAGPGDPELITVKGRRLLRSAELVVFAGSLVPRQLLAECLQYADIRDSANMTLEQTHACLLKGHRDNKRIVRLHTGDPSLYGTILEQIRLLAEDGVSFRIVPGVSCAFAAAADAAVSFTTPEDRQTLIITRASGRTAVPETQDIERLAESRAAMAIYLSGTMAHKVQKKLLRGGLEPETRVIIGHKVGWPGGRVKNSSLAEMAATAREMEISGQAVFLVLPSKKENRRSRLYAPEFSHKFRK